MGTTQRCSICGAAATGTFRYRTHNPTRVPEEPLCADCAALTKGAACVAEFELTEPPGGATD
jgi:hypothetical protein